MPTNCIIATGTVLPALAQMRSHVDDMIREHRSHDGRLDRLHLQADDASRRLTRLESMVEAQTREAAGLSRRLDSLDSKVGALVDGFDHVRDGIDTLMKAFTDHGILVTERHNKRMRGQMALWATLGGSLIILSSLHYQATGTTALEAMAAMLGKFMP